MKFDPNGVVSRWDAAARRGTLTNIGWFLGAMSLIAYGLTRLV
jgi:hypothetical protein